MNESALDPVYERFVATLLKFRKNDVPIDENTRLLSIGVDSLDTISLLVDLEAALEVQIPDQALSADAFDTVGTLWSTVKSCLR